MNHGLHFNMRWFWGFFGWGFFGWVFFVFLKVKRKNTPFTTTCSFSVGTRFDTEDRTLKDMALATRSPSPVGNKNMSL